MELINKCILIASPEPWNHIFVSKHHYAVHLAKKGNQVFFLNPPAKNEGIAQTEYENLSVLKYKGFIKGLRFFPKALRKFMVRKVWKRLEQRARVKFDVIWSFDNSVFFDFDVLPERVLKISHIVDLNQDFETQRAAKSADICFAVIPQLVQRLKHFNNNTYLIRHGVSVPQAQNPIKLPGDNPKKALYFGNLAMPHLDWEVFRKACTLSKEVDFLLVGSDSERVPPEVWDVENAYFLPPVKSDLLTSYMESADVLFLFYTDTYNHSYASPHKLLEYLLSGKPIVSTYLKDYEGSGLIEMSNENEDWPLLFKQTVKNLELENHPDKVLARRKYALNNTYEKQIERIERILNEIN